MNKEQQIAKLQLEVDEANRKIGQGKYELVEDRMEMQKKIDTLVDELHPQIIGTICVTIRTDGKVHIFGSDCVEPFCLRANSSDLGNRLLLKIRDMRSQFIRELVSKTETTDTTP